MLFLWSREPVSGPRAGPWFAWFATAVVLWRCRRRIAKAILAVSPLRFIRRRCVAPVNPNAQKSSGRIQPTAATRQNLTSHENSPKLSVILQPKHTTGIKTRVKRLCTGDGPHVSSCAGIVQSSQQVNYRVTRSGRVYGKYANKVAATM